jgi:hypothetical protein
MADNQEGRPAQAPVIPVYALHAPTIFYEWAPAFGFTNGVVNLTLAANRTWIGQDGAVVNEQVVVAHLRGNVQAALSLRDSLDKALLLAASTPEGQADPSTEAVSPSALDESRSRDGEPIRHSE